MDFFNLKNANPKQVHLEQTSIIQDLNNASSKQLPCTAIVNTNIMGTDWKVYFTEDLQRWRQDDRMIKVEKVHYVQYFWDQQKKYRIQLLWPRGGRVMV